MGLYLGWNGGKNELYVLQLLQQPTGTDFP